MSNFVTHLIAISIVCFAVLAVSFIGGFVVWIVWPLTGEYLGLPAMPYINCVALYLLFSVLFGFRKLAE